MFQINIDMSGAWSVWAPGVLNLAMFQTHHVNLGNGKVWYHMPETQPWSKHIYVNLEQSWV